MTDPEFLSAFEDQSLPREKWTHRAHLRVACLYLAALGFEESLPKIRSGIRAFNAAKGVVDGPESGYHETVTVAWLRLVNAELRERGLADSAERFLDGLAALQDKRALLRYYSRERIMSPEAKREFVEPDLEALPGI